MLCWREEVNDLGQRLVINILYNGERLANAYFHWGAYTRHALGKTRSIFDEALWKMCDNRYNALTGAIELLEETGAGVNEEERVAILREFSGRIKNRKFCKCVDRNLGLLCITNEGMNENESWADSIVSIDLGTCFISFDVFFYDVEPESDGVIVDMPYDIERIPFDVFYDFEQHVMKHLESTFQYKGRYIACIY